MTKEVVSKIGLALGACDEGWRLALRLGERREVMCVSS